MIETSDEIERQKMELDDGESSDSAIEEEDNVIEIARALASNTLKERNVAFKRLETFLFETDGFILDHDSSLKVWKGLFFMLWHSDGYVAQEQLCNRLGKMLTKFENVKNRMNFLQGAVCIINREWMGIDRLRMDKYMLVLRLGDPTFFITKISKISKNLCKEPYSDLRLKCWPKTTGILPILTGCSVFSDARPYSINNQLAKKAAPLLVFVITLPICGMRSLFGPVVQNQTPRSAQRVYCLLSNVG